MREIKFRSKRIDTGEWAYGLYVYEEGWHYIVVPEYLGDGCSDCGSPCAAWHLVDVETVGQYIGLKDNNGKEIYEGDVVRTHFSFGHEVTQEPFVIKWNKERAMFEGSKPKPLENDYLVTFSFFPEQRFLYEIIGNIHDNPELLGV